MKFKENKGT